MCCSDPSAQATDAAHSETETRENTMLTPLLDVTTGLWYILACGTRYDFAYLEDAYNWLYQAGLAH